MKIIIERFYALNRGKGLKQFEKFKREVLTTKEGYAKLFRSFFPDSDGLLNLVLLSTMHQVSFNIIGPHCYLNSILAAEKGDRIVILDPVSGQFSKNNDFDIRSFEASSASRHLKRWIKMAVASTSLVNFVNLTEDNRLSTCLKKIQVKDRVLSTSSKRSNASGFDVLKMTEENQLSFYDIDSIHGITEWKSLIGFKSEVIFKVKLSNKYRIINRVLTVMVDGCLKPIRDCYSIRVGYIQVEKNLTMPIFLILGIVELSLKKEEIEKVDAKITEALKESFLLANKHFKSTSRSKSLYINNKTEFGGVLSGEELKEVLEIFSKMYTEHPIFIYYECFGCKNSFSSDTIDSLTMQLWNFMDLNYLQPTIDICCNVGFKDIDDYTVLYPDGFIENITSAGK